MNNKWNLINYALVFVLIILLVVIGAIYISSGQDNNPADTTETADFGAPVEKEITPPKTTTQPETVKTPKVEIESDQTKSTIKDESENNDTKVDEKTIDDTDKSSENAGEIKLLTGVLEKAEDDNEYGGNYKIKLPGNTEYTYLYLSDSMVDNAMIGHKVEIEVEYQDDGTFIITGGPDLAS